jgi:hypothetical protein
LANVPTVHAPCYRLDAPIVGETQNTIWRAPVAGRITAVYCDADGVNSQALFDLRIDDGTPAAMGLPASCTEAGATFTPTGDTGVMAQGDRLDLLLGDLLGAVSRLSVCWTFQPGA